MIVGASAAPYVFGVLLAEDPRVRQTAIEVLMQIRDPVVVPNLVDALRDVDQGVRAAAVLALAEIGDNAVIPDLLRALRDEDVSVRAFAAAGLGKIGHASAVRGLLAALQDPEDRVGEAAAEALQRIGTAEALAAVESWRGDILRIKDWAKRRTAVMELGETGGFAAISTLLKVLEEDKESFVRQAAAAALEQIGSPQALEAVEKWRRGQSAG